jgi:hypothetical protein
VIDYRVSFALASSSSYNIFQSGVVNKNVIVTGLSPGVTYKFIVQARNIIGLSSNSASVSVLAA